MYNTTTIVDSSACLRWNRVALFITANYHQNYIGKVFSHQSKRRQQFRKTLVVRKATNVSDHLCSGLDSKLLANAIRSRRFFRGGCKTRRIYAIAAT
jgi:hypothetical protein